MTIAILTPPLGLQTVPPPLPLISVFINVCDIRDLGRFRRTSALDPCIDRFGSVFRWKHAVHLLIKAEHRFQLDQGCQERREVAAKVLLVKKRYRVPQPRRCMCWQDDIHGVQDQRGCL
jgi:hypothetical protein